MGYPERPTGTGEVMTHEDKLKLIVTAIENMVAVQIAIIKANGSRISPEQARQELLRALVQALDDNAMDWKPIETAPDDGTKILCCFLGQFDWHYFVCDARGGDTGAPGCAAPDWWCPIYPPGSK
jgi:hypothetical protein